MGDKITKVKTVNKIWITSEGLVVKMISEMNQNNVIIVSESKFEYDDKIKITEPID